ncbi:MAG: hypothetical protein JSW71_18630 [Gemmatimonadota bacterium]|nr:MAG: hypothetical protein JSW71_18630 [Gemmatimonadota bacterium]
MRMFSKAEAVRFGWTTVMANLGLAIVAMLIVLMINVFPVYTESTIVALVSAFFTMVVALGVMRMALRFVDGDRGELVDLFAKIPLIVPYLIASIVVGFITTIGFMLLIIPGIYLGLRLQFFGWVIVDKEAGPLDAVAESWEITRGSAWQLFLLWWVLFFVNVLGLIALGIGLLVTVPLSVVAMGYVYRSLEQGGADERPSEGEEY